MMRKICFLFGLSVFFCSELFSMGALKSFGETFSVRDDEIGVHLASIQSQIEQLLSLVQAVVVVPTLDSLSSAIARNFGQKVAAHQVNATITGKIKTLRELGNQHTDKIRAQEGLRSAIAKQKDFSISVLKKNGISVDGLTDDELKKKLGDLWLAKIGTRMNDVVESMLRPLRADRVLSASIQHEDKNLRAQPDYTAYDRVLVFYRLVGQKLVDSYRATNLTPKQKKDLIDGFGAFVDGLLADFPETVGASAE